LIWLEKLFQGKMLAFHNYNRSRNTIIAGIIQLYVGFITSTATNTTAKVATALVVLKLSQLPQV
jgi:hypothetical protein